MNQKNVNGLLGFGVGAVLLTRDFAYDGHGGAVADLVPGVWITPHPDGHPRPLALKLRESRKNSGLAGRFRGRGSRESPWNLLLYV